MEDIKKYKRNCEVCGKTIYVDIYKQGECPYCGWWNCFLNEENPNSLAMPNTISLNKAKKLYAEGKPFQPDFDDFIACLINYGEMQFEHNGTYYAVEKVKNGVDFYNSKTKESQLFNSENDFKSNAKIGNNFLKDIWNQTTDRYWLQ